MEEINIYINIINFGVQLWAFSGVAPDYIIVDIYIFLLGNVIDLNSSL